jgi:hypothetical protein
LAGVAAILPSGDFHFYFIFYNNNNNNNNHNTFLWCVFSQPMTQTNAQIAMQPNTIGWGLAAKLKENHYGGLASNRYYYWGLAAKNQQSSL